MTHLPFNEIVRRADAQLLMDARQYVSDVLHVALDDVPFITAVAYIDKHFEQGTYSGWEGWVEMGLGDEESVRRAKERQA
jgi:hypothetical protein